MTLFPLVRVCSTGSRKPGCGEGGTGIPRGPSLVRLFRKPRVFAVVALLSLAGCATGERQIAVDSDPVTADSLNTLEKVLVTTEADSTLVALMAKAPLRYTIFPATDPDRVLVYLQDIQVESLGLADPLDLGGIHRIYPEAVEEEGATLTRLVIELAEPLQHHVREEGANLTLVFRSDNTRTAEVTSETVMVKDAGGGPAAAPDEAGSPALSASGEPSPEDKSVANAPSSKWEEDGVLEEFGDSFTRLTIQNVVGESGFKYFLLESPPRIVVDVGNPVSVPAFDSVSLKGKAFEQLRTGRYPEKVRFVLDGRGGLPEVVVRAEGQDLMIQSGSPDLGLAGTNASAVGAETLPKADVPPWQPIEVTGIDLLETEQSSDVVITTRGKAAFDVQEFDGEILVILPGAALPERLLKPVDTSSSQTAVVGIVPKQSGSGPAGQARLTIRLREKRPYHVQQEDGTLRVSVQLPEKPPAPPAGMVQAPPPQERKEVAAPAAVEKPREAEKPRAALPKPPAPMLPATEKLKEPVPYTGKKVSLDFKDADIQNVLRLIAEVSGKNIVISEAVQGKVTIRLMEVPWDMALDVILKTYALDKEELGPNILRVAPFTQLKKEREESLRADEARENVESLGMEIVPVNYARAKDLETLLVRFKSKRTDAGILVDSRTNSVILRDLPANIEEMVRVIRELDTQTPQVLIEAKIVELNVDFARDLGIQWGAFYQAGPATGNPTGMNFPNTVGIGGAVDKVTGVLVPGISSPVVNLPAAIDTAAGGALGLSLGSLTNAFKLDAQLSALEKQKRARVLSSPRVATLNNQEARIEQGQEVPYQTVSDEGTKIEFKDAKLKLSVTPQITFDRSIVMNILVSNDTPIKDPTVGFIIQKKEAQTSVLVKDGETAVIGGIFTNNDSETEGGVPWLMDLPGVGSLFKKKGRTDLRTELIIFITPRIIPMKQEKSGEWIQ